MFRDVGVVGGGPAGLAAAWALASAGVRVTLYDRRPEPGGLLRTDELDGARADVAVQLLGGQYKETIALARAAGVGDLLVRAPGRDALWRAGRAHTLTYGSVSSMAASTALPTGLKIRLAARYIPYLRRHAAILDANAPASAAELDVESIAEWGRRELGDDFVELLVYPQLASYYATTPERTSAPFYHALARVGLDLSLYAVRGGTAELARAIGRALEARGARFVGEIDVRAVRAGPSGVEVTWDGGGALHEAVVVAVPPRTAAAITGLDGPIRTWFDGVRENPAASVALVVEGQVAADYFGLSVPRVEAPGDALAAVCIQGRKGAGLDGAEKSVIVAYPSPAAMPRILEAGPEEALAAMLPSIENVLPEVAGRIARARVYRFPDAGVAFYPGYLRYLAAFDADWLPSRLALAGDYLVAPTVEGAVRSGLAAARRLLGG